MTLHDVGDVLFGVDAGTENMEVNLIQWRWLEPYVVGPTHSVRTAFLKF